MVRTLGQLAEHVGGDVRGDANCKITGIATLQNAKAGDISFLANPRYTRYLSVTAASAVILTEEYRMDCPTNALVVTDPYLSYALIAALLSPPVVMQQGRHPSAVIDPASTIDPTAWVGPHSVIEEGVEIAAQVMVGPGCFIGRNSRIGAGSRLVANVTVCHGSRIGNRSVIHPGVVIGSDGFGLANDGGSWVKVPQLGAVTIGDDVEIGANTTIDRGALDDTVIEDGVKLDNQIQVAHNVYIGAHTAIAGCTGIAGSARIGARCTIGGGVGIVGHTEIADDVHITGMSFVAHSIRKPGVYSSGTPLESNHDWRKNYARFHHLDDMARRLRHLEVVIKNRSDKQTATTHSAMKDKDTMSETVPSKESSAENEPEGASDPHSEAAPFAMDIHEVFKYLPHRYPFLMIDRVLACVPGDSLVALKNVSINEAFFMGHFPRRPVMPGVLIIEAMAQATGILAFKTAQATPASGTMYYLAAVDNARFKQPVEPGDQLILNVKLHRAVRGVWKFSGEAKVGDKIVASADLMCANREVDV